MLYECFARKKIKLEDELTVGDEVEFLVEDNSFTIEKILPRKNSLVRPKIANVDQLVIVLAPVPKPDLLLIDKLVIYGLKNGLDVVLCINKCDLAENDFIEEVKAEYNLVVKAIVTTSAKNGTGIDTLKAELKDKLSVFAGQSAVGKSTILNAITLKKLAKTDVLSARSERGKHTTRHSEIFEIMANTFIADTPGFSLLELFDVKSANLKNYYDEFDDYKDECKYKNCTHTDIKNELCAVKRAVELGKINKERYNRYVEIYRELKQKEDTLYD